MKTAVVLSWYLPVLLSFTFYPSLSHYPVTPSPPPSFSLLTPHTQPLFITLSQVWSGFQDEVVLLSVLSNLLNSMVPFTKVCVCVCVCVCVTVCTCARLHMSIVYVHECMHYCACVCAPFIVITTTSSPHSQSTTGLGMRLDNSCIFPLSPLINY